MRRAKTLEAANYHVQTSELFQKEHIQVHQNWQENVVTALSDPTAVGISSIFLPQVALFLITFKILLKTFKMHKYLLIDILLMRLQGTLRAKITQTTVMMSSAKWKNDRLVSQILHCNNQISVN